MTYINKKNLEAPNREVYVKGLPDKGDDDFYGIIHHIF